MGFFEDRFGAHGFIGEHLWLGHLGFFLLVASFSAAFLSFVSYCFAEFGKGETDKNNWQRIGRVAYGVHGASVLGIFVLLFVMILNHWFEYHYAWHHSSRELPMKYIISSFWEGQEGSFLLWQFWLVVMGLIGIRVLRDWERPVLGMTAITQVFLGSMVLGINIFGHKIGSNPFTLLRNEMLGAPIFQRPEYLSFIADGNGLNPLLQNYWMTIHPPVLFCGFASVLFPFAFVVGALIRRDYTGWVKPALPWVLFCVAVLGTGILMGGAWAYESLSFGGFWAWDPVENMSLVPWLFVVAGLHLHLVYKYTKHGLFSAFLFYILGFSMVLYSTFLTRSGILGDTSVHAFTDLGMTGQLVIYLAVFLVPSLVLLFFRYRELPTPVKEEELYSREFWMFIGALVLLFSAIQMTFTTSIPVWNILFFDMLHKMGMMKDKLAPPADVIAHYNGIQIWLAILAGIGTGLIQYFAYTAKKIPSTARWALYSFGMAMVLSIATAYFMHVDFVLGTVVFEKNIKIISPYFLMLLSAYFAVVANVVYIITVLKNNIRLSGGAISHFGFGVFLVGVLISQYKKEVVSLNTKGEHFGKEFTQKDLAENILLERGQTQTMDGYEVTYKKSIPDKPNTRYEVDYLRRNKDGSIDEQFSLYPNAQINPKMGMLANPDTKHYWTKDVFTHVSSLPNNAELKDKKGEYDAGVGDTFFTKKYFVIFTGMNSKPQVPDGYDMKNKLAVAANLDIRSLDGISVPAQPLYIINLADNSVSMSTFENDQLAMSISIARINPETKKFTFAVTEKEQASDFIILKAIVFPWIKLVWLGGIITFLGVLLSMYRRMTENKPVASPSGNA